MEQDTSWNVHHYTDLNALISIGTVVKFRHYESIGRLSR